MNLLETEGFPLLLRRGRWALAVLETGLSIFMALWFRNRPAAAWIAMLLLFGYNVIVLILLHRLPLKRTPISLFLLLDLVFLGNVSYYTGANSSPFIGQCYLIVFVAALFFNVKGGIIVGGLAAAMMFSLEFLTVGTHNWEGIRDSAPYFVIVGGFTGFLVAQMKTWFTRYQESVAREADQQRTEQAYQRELELAREVQRSSLPLAPPTIVGAELALRTEPSREVGGDFHVFVTDPTGLRLGVAVGDVSGKGIAAALTATSIGYLLPYLEPLRMPHAALVRLNKDLSARLPETSFATLIYTEFNLETGIVRVWNAGHPPAFIWRSRDGHVEDTSAGVAPPLGLFTAWRAPEQELQLAPGDLMLLHSDGITEVRDPDGHFFGEDRLHQLVAAHAAKGPTALLEAILAAVHAYGEPSDDLTLVALQRSIAYPGI